MRCALVLGLCIFVTGCASVDPVPYDPVAEINGPPGLIPGVRASPPVPKDSIKKTLAKQQSSGSAGYLDWPSASDLSADADYMRYLGASYEIARNQVLEQKPFFDFTTVAFAAAAGANGIFEGSKVATTVLGLTAGGSAATELYFSPQTKIEAYNNAWAALDCGADVADQINPIISNQSVGDASTPLTIDSPLSEVISTLSKEINTANDALSGAQLLNDPSQDDKSVLQTDEKALNASITAANVALLNAQNAKTLLGSAGGQLQIFTDSVVKITSNKILTGEDDSTQLLALLKTAQQGGPLTGTSSILALENQTTVSPPSTALVLGPTTSDSVPSGFPAADDALRAETTFLNAQSVLAQLRTDEVNGIWSNLTTCALKTS